MGYDFDSVKLPKLKKRKGTISAIASERGTVRICSRDNPSFSELKAGIDGAWCCIEVSREDAIELAKFLSETYL